MKKLILLILIYSSTASSNCQDVFKLYKGSKKYLPLTQNEFNQSIQKSFALQSNYGDLLLSQICAANFITTSFIKSLGNTLKEKNYSHEGFIHIGNYFVSIPRFDILVLKSDGRISRYYKDHDQGSWFDLDQFKSTSTKAMETKLKTYLDLGNPPTQDKIKDKFGGKKKEGSQSYGGLKKK